MTTLNINGGDVTVVVPARLVQSEYEIGAEVGRGPPRNQR